MLEKLVVGLVVGVAFAYAAWALLPPGLRASLADRIGAWRRVPGRRAWLAGAAARLERFVRARGGGCSDCSASESRPEPRPDRRLPPT